MYYKLLGGLLLLIGGTALANHQQWPLEIIEHLDDTKIVIYAGEADIAKTPAWKPADGAPPFKLSNLLQSIDRWRHLTPTKTHLKIHAIELKPILHHEKQNRWYYLVQMKDGTGKGQKTYYLAVLMDGTLLPAIEEPAALK